MATTVALIVKFLGKIISVNIIRDIKESYLVRKNPINLCVGVSVNPSTNAFLALPFSEK
jgi:hypothetical protein